MKKLIGNREFYRTVAVLALPLLLQNAVSTFVNLLDNLMVGALGDSAISGVYMGSQSQTLLQLFSGGIEGAILILSAQYWGKGDRGSIKKIVSIGVDSDSQENESDESDDAKYRALLSLPHFNGASLFARVD